MPNRNGSARNRPSGGAETGDGIDPIAQLFDEGVADDTDRTGPSPAQTGPRQTSRAQPVRPPDGEDGTPSSAPAGHRGRTRRPARILVLAAVLLLVLAAAVAFAPRLTRNAATQVVDADTELLLQAGEARAAVQVPAGWHRIQFPWRNDTLALETPDSVLEIAITLHESGTADEATTELGTPEAHAGVLTWRGEQPSRETHADYAILPSEPSGERAGSDGLPFGDGAPVTTVMLAVLRPTDAAEPGPVVAVRIRADQPVEAYLGTIAGILSTVQFA